MQQDLNDLSCMSWEPCILKHPARYDNPWDYDYDIYQDRKSRRISKPVLLYDCMTLKITDHPGGRAIDEMLGMAASLTSKAIKSGHKIKGRYIAGFDIQQLFDNMKKHGLT
jgi:hypothetical protein